jgi:hypothetical protein
MSMIWKYVLNHGMTVLSMPADAKILTAEVQYDAICLWAKIIPESPRVTRTFIMFGTGHPITVPDAQLMYINTIQMDDGSFIGHIFEVLL